MAMPLVSIITPCYNGETFLEHYFQAVLDQTYQNLELIFVNDGSADRTEEIALSYRNALESRGIVFKYLHQSNGGQAKAMNTGFREMTGKYLVWPDSDDWLEPDAIEKRVEFLESHPEFDFVRSSGDYIDSETGNRLGTVNFCGDASGEDIFLDLILEKTYCACGCYMIKSAKLREIYPDLKIYETDVGQNWQILIPIAGRCKCGYINEEQYHIAVRQGSHSRSRRTTEQEIARQMELKKVLLIGIEKSGRRDRDYAAIVELKYLHILYSIYMNAEEYERAKEYYRALEQHGAVQPEEYTAYLRKWHPLRYRVHCGHRLVRRALGKIGRAVFG